MFRSAKSRFASALWICILVLVVAPAGAAPRSLPSTSMPFLTQLAEWWQSVWSGPSAPAGEGTEGSAEGQPTAVSSDKLSTDATCVTILICIPGGWEFEPWG